MQNVLILGCHGFIGNNLWNHFLSLEGFVTWGADLGAAGETHYLTFDPVSPDFRTLLAAVEFDFCINCTGAANVSDSLKAPVRDFQLNAMNVLSILEAIRLQSPKTKFLNLSSAAVYGNPQKLPVQEKDPLQPISPYGLHKQMAELLCTEYSRFFGVGTCSVRIFSAYGPGLRKQILWDLYQKTLGGKEVRLGGTGKETRDFVFIDDICSAIEIVVKRADFQANVFNLASGEETTLADLAKLVMEGLDCRLPLVFEGISRPGDPLNWRADVTKLEEIGFRPNISIRQGVAECTKWLRELGS